MTLERKKQNLRICLAFTGASGLPYGLRLLECLLAAQCEVALLYSEAAQIVAQEECDFVLPNAVAEAEKSLSERFLAQPGQLKVYARNDWFAPIASGSGAPDAMIICPCSMGTLAAIAHGLSDSLLERAADVALKEKRKLILVPRETPLSIIHLENMLRLAQAGATILPPAPGFYYKPQSVEDLIDFVVARILNQIGVAHSVLKVWGLTPV